VPGWDLRTIFAMARHTLSLAAGVDLKTVQAMLRHSTIVTTANSMKLTIGPGGALYIGALTQLSKVDTVNGTVTPVATMNVNPEGKRVHGRVKLTPLTFVAKALLSAVADNPTLNSSWAGDEIILHRSVTWASPPPPHVGCWCRTSRTPVLWTCSRWGAR
jgi:2-oxoacid dehydrogenase/acyltransferase catalytic subunit